MFRNFFIALPIAVLAVGGSTACASKKFVRTSVGEVNDKVDSLGRFLRLVKSDSATQERIAREEFGMVRGDKEILYRFGEDPGTSGGKSR